MSAPFTCHRAAAMALITSGAALRSREGSFLGQIAFTDEALSERQSNWLAILLKRHGLPDLADGADNV